MTTTLPPLPELRGGIFKHTTLGELYDRLQVEQRMVAYATQARTDLEAENKRLRALLEEISRANAAQVAPVYSELARAALEKQP